MSDRPLVWQDSGLKSMWQPGLLPNHEDNTVALSLCIPASSGHLVATLAGAVYIVDINATGGDSDPFSDGTDDEVPPLRGAC